MDIFRHTIDNLRKGKVSGMEILGKLQYSKNSHVY